MANYGLPGYGLELDLEADLDKFRFWILYPMCGDGWTPMFTWVWNCDFASYGSQRAAQFLHLPTTKGIEWRQKDGGSYARTMAITDPEERSEREQIYRERIRPFIEDIDKVWEEGGYKEKLFNAYEHVQAVDMESLNDVDLCKFFEEKIRPMHRMQAEFHYIFAYVFFDLPRLFWGECKSLGISMYDPKALTLLQGVDNKFVKKDIEIWNLSRSALGKGIDEVLRSHGAGDVISKLRQSEAGTEWLKELDAFLDVWGYTMPRVSELITKTHLEDPTPIIASVKRFIDMPAEESPELKQNAQKIKREVAEKEFFSKVPPEKRGYISVLLKAAQKCSRWADEHSIDFDEHGFSLIRLWCMEMGKRFAEKGALNQPEDIFFLIPDETLRWLHAPEYYDIDATVKKRRRIWEENRKRSQTQEGYWPPFIAVSDCTPEEVLETSFMDPIMASLGAGLLEPPSHPEVEADLHGKPGAVGVGEGVARIVLKDEDLAVIKKGDVLVSTAIFPSWGGGLSFGRGSSD